MNFLDNLLISLCFTFSLSDHGQGLFIRPVVSLMPEKVFTNQANYERAKGKCSAKIFKRWITLNPCKAAAFSKAKFMVRLPVPDVSLNLNQVAGHEYFKVNTTVYSDIPSANGCENVMNTLCFSSPVLNR